MTIKLTLQGSNIVIESDDATTTVRIADDTSASEKTYRYVPADILDFIMDIKNVVLSPFGIGGDFVENQRVEHEEWGLGTVICMSNDGQYGVEFDERVGFCHNCTSPSCGFAWGRTGTRRTSSWCRKRELKAIDDGNADKRKDPIEAINHYIETKSK